MNRLRNIVLFAIAGCFPLTTTTAFALAIPNDPVAVGDVVAKPLNRAGMESLGHVGIYAAPNKIVQVNNGTAYVNVVQNLSIDTFKKNAYWGAKAKPTFNFKAPYTSASNQITTLAAQQSPYVSYDLFNFTAKPATMSCQAYTAGKCTSYKWTKGVFRCDTFVKWLYNETGNGQLAGMYPSDMFFNNKQFSITR